MPAASWSGSAFTDDDDIGYTFGWDVDGTVYTDRRELPGSEHLQVQRPRLRAAVCQRALATRCRQRAHLLAHPQREGPEHPGGGGCLRSQLVGHRPVRAVLGAPQDPEAAFERTPPRR